MKNSMDNMDDLFKRHFEQTTTEVADKEELWIAIGRERSSKKRILLWVFLVGVIVSGLGIYIISDTSENNKFVPEKSINIEQHNSENVPINIKSKDKAAEPIASSSSNEEDAQIEGRENKPNSSTLSSKISTFQVSNNKEKTNVRASKIPLTPTNIIYNIEQTTQNVIVNDHSIINQSKVLKTKIFDIINLNNLALQKVEYTPKNQFLEVEKIDLDEVNRKWDKCQVKESGKPFLDGYVQASFPIENIYQRNDSDGIEAYQALWEEKITPFISYQTGMQIGYQFPWNGYISGGLSYQHFETKYENIQTVTERITIFDEMAYFYIDDAGETVWVADSVTATNVYDRQQTFANQHQLWHIPIQLGYISDWNSWRFGANLEGTINISKTYQGHFINFDNSVIELNKTQAKDYVSNSIGISLSAGIHLGYMLNENWELYANPRFRTNNLSFLGSDQALDIKYQFAGLRTGLKYWF